jgi:hypothetical protein
MCLPITPAIGAFPGNIGPENFYNLLTLRADTRGLRLNYIAGLEAAYGSPDGAPVKGTEIVFARIRILASVDVAGTYKVVHPFGTEVFTNVQPGPDAISFTRDIGVGTFDGPLNGDLGPFIEWVNTAGTGRTNTGEVLDIFNPTTARTERYLGDPNLLHTFKGSPTGFNKLRVEGPVGMGGTLSGTIEFVEETRGNVQGWEWTAPIPTPFAITRAVYTRTATLFAVDVFATSTPGQQLIVTGPTPLGMVMTDLGNGNYHVHIESATAPALPLSVTVYSVLSNPIISRSAPLEDIITIRSATLTRGATTSSLVVSSDQRPPHMDTMG